ncbi:hypothetical protein ACVJBD_006781 [Rhizobium mongolense]
MFCLAIAILGIAEQQAGTGNSFAVPVPGHHVGDRSFQIDAFDAPSLISYRRLPLENNWNIFRGPSLLCDCHVRVLPLSKFGYHLIDRSRIASCAVSRVLIIAGLVVVAVGILWPWLERIGLGRLPGDFLIERENFSIYIPITTGLLFSILLSVMLWLLSR